MGAMAGVARRMAAIGFAAAVLVAAAAPAGAVGVIVGFTWYSDGSFSKSNASGVLITAYATQAKANTQYRLMAAPALPTGEGCPDANKVNVNPNLRVSNSSGTIGNTSGPITGAPGNYHVCFYEPGTLSNSATAPVFFTII
jgi:hypothetical protein